MIDFYTPLPLKLRFNGFDYTQVYRTDCEAIYEQRVSESCTAYEVFIIKKIPEKIIKGKIIMAHERFPRNEDFGKSAWTYPNLTRAMNKLLELLTKRNELNNESIQTKNSRK